MVLRHPSGRVAAIGNTCPAAEVKVLLALSAAHGTDALIGALRRALAFSRFRAADVAPVKCYV